MTSDERTTDVCIVLLTGIGDVVHGLPVANALKDDDPARRITWVAEPAPDWADNTAPRSRDEAGKKAPFSWKPPLSPII